MRAAASALSHSPLDAACDSATTATASATQDAQRLAAEREAALTAAEAAVRSLRADLEAAQAAARNAQAQAQAMAARQPPVQQQPQQYQLPAAGVPPPESAYAAHPTAAAEVRHERRGGEGWSTRPPPLSPLPLRCRRHCSSSSEPQRQRQHLKEGPAASAAATLPLRLPQWRLRPHRAAARSPGIVRRRRRRPSSSSSSHRCLRLWTPPRPRPRMPSLRSLPRLVRRASMRPSRNTTSTSGRPSSQRRRCGPPVAGAMGGGEGG